MSNSAAITEQVHHEGFEIELSYAGPSVASGAIRLDDVLLSLQGFSTAFRNLATTRDLRGGRLGLRAARPGSFVVVLAFLGPAEISAGAAALSAAVAAVGLIVGTLKSLRNGKREEQTETVEAALVRLMTPLRTGEVERIEIRAQYTDRIIHQTLTVEDKNAIQEHRKSRPRVADSIAKQLPEVAEERQLSAALTAGSPMIKFAGTIEALKKSTNEGELVLEDGTTVPCRLVGPESERLYKYFASLRPLRIIGSPRLLDDTLSGIDVVDIEAD
jgi:hypothetical protein